jgi:hypothetical protein
MRTLLYVAAAIVNGAITLEKILIARKVWRSDRRVLNSLGFMIAFTLSIILQINPVGASIDKSASTVGIPWLLSSISLMAALHFVVFLGCDLLEVTGFRWRYPTLLVASSVLLFAFLSDVVILGNVQRWAVDSLPQSRFSCMSMAAPNIYNTIMGAVAFVLFFRLYRQDDVYLTRLRWGIVTVVALFGTAHHLTRTISILIGYVQPAAQILDVLGPITTIAKVIAGLLWPLGALSNRTYQAVGIPPLNKRAALAAIKAFHEKVNRRLGLAQMPMTAAVETVNTGQWKQSDLQLYQTAIAVVDRKKILASRSIDQPDQEARSICEALAAIDGSTEFHEIITLCKKFNTQQGED